MPSEDGTPLNDAGNELTQSDLVVLQFVFSSANRVACTLAYRDHFAQWRLFAAHERREADVAAAAKPAPLPLPPDQAALVALFETLKSGLPPPAPSPVATSGSSGPSGTSGVSGAGESKSGDSCFTRNAGKDFSDSPNEKSLTSFLSSGSRFKRMSGHKSNFELFFSKLRQSQSRTVVENETWQQYAIADVDWPKGHPPEDHTVHDELMGAA